MFIFHKETTLEDLGNGVTRRILAHDGKMMAVEVNFDAGAIGPMHNHPHEQLTYVLSGEFEFTIGERNAWSAPAIRSIKSRGLCTAASA
jgi:quercetin dioxygenase-like cupin family protein